MDAKRPGAMPGLSILDALHRLRRGGRRLLQRSRELQVLEAVLPDVDAVEGRRGARQDPWLVYLVRRELAGAVAELQVHVRTVEVETDAAGRAVLQQVA